MRHRSRSARRPTRSPAGREKSTVGKVFVIGAVERLPGNKSGRIRLETIAEEKRDYELLGHTRIDATQRYAHLIESPLRAGVSAAGEMPRPRWKQVGQGYSAAQ